MEEKQEKQKCKSIIQNIFVTTAYCTCDGHMSEYEGCTEVVTS